MLKNTRIKGEDKPSYPPLPLPAAQLLLVSPPATEQMGTMYLGRPDLPN